MLVLEGKCHGKQELSILKNDFGSDFLADDLPEDGVVTRSGDLSLGDLICHLGLLPKLLKKCFDIVFCLSR